MMLQVPISARLRGRLDQLGRTQRHIATVILADPMAAMTMSIRELADAAGVSQASISRFCRSLGLEGYAQLRLELAAEQGNAATASAPVGDIAEGDDLRSVVGKIARLDAEAVIDTARLLDIDELGRAIEVLSRARRIDVYGVGASAIVGADLVQKLTRVGRAAVAYGDAHLGLTSAALLREGDVAIAISHSGATKDTRDMLAVANEGGATTIAVTNNVQSPLAAAADHVLVTAAHESVFRAGATASRLAQLVVVDCLFVGLAQRTFDESQAALQATYRALRGRSQTSSDPNGKGKATT